MCFENSFKRNILPDIQGHFCVEQEIWIRNYTCYYKISKMKCNQLAIVFGKKCFATVYHAVETTKSFFF